MNKLYLNDDEVIWIRQQIECRLAELNIFGHKHDKDVVDCYECFLKSLLKKVEEAEKGG